MHDDSTDRPLDDSGPDRGSLPGPGQAAPDGGGPDGGAPGSGSGDGVLPAGPGTHVAPTPARRRALRRYLRGAAAFVVLVGVFVAAFVVPVPFVVESPGPTFDVTSSSDDTPMIDISGKDPRTGEPVEVDPVRKVGDGSGALRMVTVYENGGPGRRLNFVELLQAWLDERDRVIPFDEAYPADVTQKQIDEAAAAQMQSSQSTAGVAALEALGWTVPATVRIEGAVAGSGAEGKVEQGQRMVALTTPDGVRHPVDSASVPFSVMRKQPVGSRIIVTVSPEGKDGETSDVEITSVTGGPGTSGSKLGIYLSADVKMPLDVKIHLEKVGGPSAGMMFALGIIDRLTPGDMTGGQSIAGTGALAYDGGVEPIGGIQQKMWGAVRDGAKWFLAPATNCDEVVGNVPDGIRVVKVSTLSDARSAVEHIAAGTGDSLPTCTQKDADALQSGSGS